MAPALPNHGHSPGLQQRKPTLFTATRCAFRTFRAAVFDAVTHSMGYECNVYPEAFWVSEPRKTTSPGFFSFERHVIDSANCEYWGFGQYVLVSRLTAARP